MVFGSSEWFNINQKLQRKSSSNSKVHENFKAENPIAFYKNIDLHDNVGDNILNNPCIVPRGAVAKRRRPGGWRSGRKDLIKIGLWVEKEKKSCNLRSKFDLLGHPARLIHKSHTVFDESSYQLAESRALYLSLLAKVIIARQRS